MPPLDMPPTLPPQQAEYALLHAARAVHDTASVRFTDFAIDGRPSWVLATVTPSPRSGSATIPGAHLDARTGEVVAPSGARAVLVKEGTWKPVVAARPSQAMTQNTYSWTESLAQRKRTLLPEDYYSPFTHGGAILCRPTPGAAGIDQFGPVRVLLPGWEGYVPSASAFAEGYPALLTDGAVGPADGAQIDQLASQDNKLLAVLAFRSLLRGGRMNPSVAQAQLARVETDVLAILVYLVITGPAPGSPGVSLRDIHGAVTALRDLDRSRAIALGAFAAGLFRGDAATPAKSLLRAVRQRLGEIGVAPDRDPYLHLMLEKMDVR